MSTGVARLDSMLGGEGFFRGSTVLVSGTSGTGRSTLAAQFCDAACRRGDRAIYFAFEESEAEIVRNMTSVGIDLGQWVDAGLLQFHCFRPTLLGLEAHLFAIRRVAAQLVSLLRPTDTVARIGGDEFVVLAPDIVSSVHALQLAARLAAELCRRPNRAEDGEDIAASIGIAFSVGGATTAEALLHDADTAMYEAKSAAVPAPSSMTRHSTRSSSGGRSPNG